MAKVAEDPAARNLGGWLRQDLLLAEKDPEKVSDDYLAALHLQEIADALLMGTNTEQPDDAGKVEPKAFAADFFTGLLIYGFESDASKKAVHVPTDARDSWS